MPRDKVVNGCRFTIHHAKKQGGEGGPEHFNTAVRDAAQEDDVRKRLAANMATVLV